MGCSVAWKCFVAWRLALSSQQPTCPQIRHSLRWTQVSPGLKHSSQPCADGSTSFIWLVWLHRCRWNICMNLLTNVLLRRGALLFRTCSKRRAFCLQELCLLGRSLPAQDLIPVREPPEPLDDVPMPCGVGGYVGRTRLVCKQPEKLDGAALILSILAVHERHIQEHPLESGDLPVQRVLDGVPGGLERRPVGGVDASVATEHVAGELVEHDNERQAAPRIVAPAVEVACGGLLVETGEPICDPGVELGVFAEPLLAELAVARLTFAAEPEVENL